MALLPAAKLTDEMLRLVWRSGPNAAIDLELRYVEIHGWFASVPVYGSMPAPTYPPVVANSWWPLFLLPLVLVVVQFGVVRREERYLEGKASLLWSALANGPTLRAALGTESR